MAHLAIFGMGVGVDLLIYTPDEYDRLKKSGNALVERVETEGVSFYEQPQG